MTPSAPEPEEELGTVTPMTIHNNIDRQTRTRPVFIPSAPSIEVTDSSAPIPSYDGTYLIFLFMIGNYELLISAPPSYEEFLRTSNTDINLIGQPQTQPPPPRYGFLKT